MESNHHTEAPDFSLILLDGKVPIEKGWQRFCEEKRTLSKSKRDGHNIGIACGPASGCIVLDVDDPEKFKETCEKNGWLSPETRTHETGRGLPHYFFEYPQDGRDYGNKSCKSMGFDIRGKGGQVVAPGSIHPDTGKPYRVRKDVPMAPAPDWMLSLYTEKPRPARSIARTATGVSRYGESALGNQLSELSQATDGERNEKLNKSAFSLGQLVAGGELDHATVENALADAARALGLSEVETRKTVQSGISGGMREPRRAPERSKRGMKKTDDRPDNKPIINDTLKCLRENESGDALIFKTVNRGAFIYDHAASQWATWAGHHWQEDTREESISGGIDAVVDVYEKEAIRLAWCATKAQRAGQDDEAKEFETTRKKIMDRIRALNAVPRRRNVLILAAAGEGLVGHEWDRPTMTIVCKNGIINLTEVDR